MKILIAEDEVITRMDISEMLKEAGHEVVAEASDGLEAVKLAETHKPDLVLMDIKMPYIDGLTAANIIIEQGSSNCIVMLSAYSDRDYVNNATQIGVFGYLLKPVNKNALIPAIEVAYRQSQENIALKDELKKEKQRLKDRIVIDRAKGYIMKNENLSEEDAYCKLREISQRKRISIRVLAESIVRQNEK